MEKGRSEAVTNTQMEEKRKEKGIKIRHIFIYEHMQQKCKANMEKLNATN